jgi:N,N'-diacetyllegionaminate synthase
MRLSMPKTIKISSKKIGPGCPCYIIAEAGSNHNGSLKQAYRLIDIAAKAGADAVKFQTFQANKMYSQVGSKPVQYLKKLGVNKTIFEIIKDMEMPTQWLPQLAQYCKKKKITFLSTPFDEQSADLLNPYVGAYKIASYELTHIPLLKHIARKKKPIIFSTGAGSMAEIKEALATIRAQGNKKIILMQCTAKYPAPLESVEVRVVESLAKKFNVPVGFSDHSRDPLVAPIAAVARGACVIEKHYTISNKLPGPDHSFALEPHELSAMVEAIRKTEKALGIGKKQCQKVEGELVNYRRALFVVADMEKAEKFTKKNLAVLRKSGDKASGIHSREYERVLGRISRKNIKAGTMLLKKYLL